MGKILIKNGRVWDGEAFCMADVLTENNRIACIAPGILADAGFSFDARGCIVSAGLVDLHAHIRGLALDKFGVQAEMACFPFGVTAANNAGTVKGDQALLDAAQVKLTAFVQVDIEDNRPCLEGVAEKISALAQARWG